MKIVDLEQGTPEWLAWRDQGCSASDAAVIMGDAVYYSKVKTWDDLRRVKEGMGEEPDERAQAAFDHGHRLEPVAREKLAPSLDPICIESDDDPRLRASLDGYCSADDTSDGVGTLWCEIKCPISGPNSRVLKHIRENYDKNADPKNYIPRHIWWQLVHQAGVIGDPDATCGLIVYIEVEDAQTGEMVPDYELKEIPAERLLLDWAELLPQWMEYMEGETQDREDDEWVDAATEWTTARLDENAAKRRKDAARKKLIALCGPQGEGRGAGVLVQQVTSQGSIDWRDCAEAIYEGDDLDEMAEAFRRPNRTSPTVRAVKA